MKSSMAVIAACMAVAVSVAAAVPATAATRGKLKANRILFLGNSITLAGANVGIGWMNSCGMAASAPEKDYVHLLLSRFTEAAHGRAPQSMVVNIATFERQYDTYNINKELEKQLAFKPDVVILAIGENVLAFATDEAKANFRKATATLLATLKQNSHPALYVRSCFWPDKTKDEILRQVCAEAGGTFVDISRLGADEANFARSEREIKHQGVAIHPGDRGMAAIADAIWKAVTSR